MNSQDLTPASDVLTAEYFLAKVESLSTDQLDDWYEEHVGYRLSEDDPSLIGMPEHGFAIAEMMCLHACGEGEVYSELLQLIEAEAANTQ